MPKNKRRFSSGLAWLATQQQANGKWIYNGGSGDVAATGAALLAFIEEGNTPHREPIAQM
ncbi:MAG UNVERIFIED_CONTAM: hypothetical protein LVR29_01390 [Microcystis novacekii LVE1205-3]